MHDPHDHAHPLRIGSLFSGYGGLDLAVEHVFDAQTVWFSEINEPVARVFAHHWPHAPNLGDITRIGWSTVPPVDILCGGFPCQNYAEFGIILTSRPSGRKRDSRPAPAQVCGRTWPPSTRCRPHSCGGGTVIRPHLMLGLGSVGF